MNGTKCLLLIRRIPATVMYIISEQCWSTSSRYPLQVTKAMSSYPLTNWGQVTHIYDGYLTIIGSVNGLSPGRRQAIIWINAGIFLIGPLGINFSEILIEIKTFSFNKMRLNVSSAKRRPFCLGLNVLRKIYNGDMWHSLSLIYFRAIWFAYEMT